MNNINESSQFSIDYDNEQYNFTNLHYIIITIAILIFGIICYYTLYREKHKKKKITKICNNKFFILFLASIYFILIIVFTYETLGIQYKSKHHIFFKKHGYNISNGFVFLTIVLAALIVKYKNYIYDMYSL